MALLLATDTATGCISILIQAENTQTVQSKLVAMLRSSLGYAPPDATSLPNGLVKPQMYFN
jgi:hypothetical protein